MRVVAGVVLALGAAAPVALSASPALAAGCTASVSDAHPAHNETVIVSFVGPASTSATVVAHYHTVDNTSTVSTDSSGKGQAGFNIGGASYGETVVVSVVIGSASCSTSFDPTAPAGTTTTTASATSTTAPARTTTTASAVLAADTATTIPAAATPSSTLAFTGNGGRTAAIGVGAFLLVVAGEVGRRRAAARRRS